MSRPKTFSPSGAIAFEVHLRLLPGLAICWSDSFRAYGSSLAARKLKITLLLTAWYGLGYPLHIGGAEVSRSSQYAVVKNPLHIFLLTQTLLTMKRIRGLLWAIILSEFSRDESFSIIQSSKVTWVGERMLGFNRESLAGTSWELLLPVTLPYIAAILVLDTVSSKSALLVRWHLSQYVDAKADRFSRRRIECRRFSVVLTWIFVLARQRSRQDHWRRDRTGHGPCGLPGTHVLWQRLGTDLGDPDIYAGQVAASATELETIFRAGPLDPGGNGPASSACRAETKIQVKTTEKATFNTPPREAVSISIHIIE